MDKLIDSLPVVMATVMLALIASMVGGDKLLRPFLWLVLLSMLVMNSGKISAKINVLKGVIQP